ncbi:hypothetical protein JKP88DRAFT_246378 [Tribonema minus]|uniref:Uncharacterized protein n=1 Tax=Tribonema minus TaxID=303371 RepID=A0A835YT74_9STRA|nr:hypothetical protein JKP88DRAFT_246378 [Tribonema minus]
MDPMRNTHKARREKKEEEERRRQSVSAAQARDSVNDSSAQPAGHAASEERRCRLAISMATLTRKARDSVNDSSAQPAGHAASEERRCRLAISMATLTRKPDKRAELVRQGAVAALIKLSNSADSRTRLSCCRAFNNLASDPELRRDLVEQGTAAAIVSMAGFSHNKALKRECVEALCKLAALPGAEVDLARAGVISCVMHVQVSQSCCETDLLVFGRLLDSLRRLAVDMARPAQIVFEQPLPSLLERVVLVTNGAANISSAGMLPAGLRLLLLHGCQHQPLEEVPPGLRVLNLHGYAHPLPPLPDTLETLVLFDCAHNVTVVDASSNLRSLSVYWRPLHHAPPLPARWPARLERLVYWGPRKSEGAEHYPCIENLPPTLRQLELNACEVRAPLPQTLQEVRLGLAFKQPLEVKGATVKVNSFRMRYD